jgi:thiol-disulfide isomerase/thioredoxin
MRVRERRANSRKTHHAVRHFLRAEQFLSPRPGPCLQRKIGSLVMAACIIKRLSLPGLVFGWVAALVLDPTRGSSLATLPEFTHHGQADWINSMPLTAGGLRGKVVLVEFWAFDCINCLHSAAFVESMADKHTAAGLVVIAVHTPELPEEKAPANVRDAVKRLAIKYPVMIDGDYSFWKAMNNHYWPAFYVIGTDGRIRAQDIGEVHIGDPAALRLESTITQLLAARN